MERLFWGVRSLCFFTNQTPWCGWVAKLVVLNFGWWSNLEFGPF